MKDLVILRLLSLAGEKILRMAPAMPRFGHGARRLVERQRVNVKKGRNTFIVPALLILVSQVPLATFVAAQETAADSDVIRRLETLVQEQQKQLDYLRLGI